jgi:hypothetical protein
VTSKILTPSKCASSRLAPVALVLVQRWVVCGVSIDWNKSKRSSALYTETSLCGPLHWKSESNTGFAGLLMLKIRNPA